LKLALWKDCFFGQISLNNDLSLYWKKDVNLEGKKLHQIILAFQRAPNYVFRIFHLLLKSYPFKNCFLFLLTFLIVILKEKGLERLNFSIKSWKMISLNKLIFRRVFGKIMFEKYSKAKFENWIVNLILKN